MLSKSGEIGQLCLFPRINEFLKSCCSVVSKLCDPMDCSMSGFLVLHHLLELAQTYVHWVSDAIQPSHPLSPPSPFAFPASGSFPMSQFFISDGKSTGASASTSVLPMNIQDWVPLGLTGLISLQSKGLSGVFSSTTVQKCQFFSAQPSLRSNSHIHTWLLEKIIALTRRTLLAKWCLCFLICCLGLS